MKAHSRDGHAAEQLRSRPDTVLKGLTDCAITIGLLAALLIIPALVVQTALWLLSAAIHTIDLTHVIPFPH